MRRLLTIGTIAIAAAALPVGVADAAPATTGACDQGSFCWFDTANYGNGVAYTDPFASGTCYGTLDNGSKSVRSYINNSSNVGVFYSGTDCTGTASGPTQPQSSNADLGFDAHSFREN
ncbi:MAG: peptidase inhibitor family I36 protein [Nocardiopsaceae bacterium]|jgi:hypothetical protein|nr:peptidase inhibitor family I36 protein [Nocardiopsaceae bacterium]